MMKQSKLDDKIESQRRQLNGTLMQHALVCDRCRLVVERMMLEDPIVEHALAEGVKPPMRAQMEIDGAHDLLMDFLKDEQKREVIAGPEVAGQLAMAADALCWALNHTVAPDYSGRFGRNFAEVLQIVSESMGRNEDKTLYGIFKREFLREQAEKDDGDRAFRLDGDEA